MLMQCEGSILIPCHMSRHMDDDKPMGILKTLHDKQVNNGIFIGLLVIFAAGIAVWWYSRPSGSPDLFESQEHPLSKADNVPLCRLLPPVSGAKLCQDASLQVTVAGHSMWKDADGKPLLRADLFTSHNLLMTGNVSTSVWFQSALPEIKASGRQDWDEPKGAWSQAVITSRDKELEILLEDNGIVLILQSNVLDKTALIAYANLAARELRKAEPVISSADDATPKWTPAAPGKP